MSEHADLLAGLHAEPGIHGREWLLINSAGRRVCYINTRSEDEAAYLARQIACACDAHEELLEAAILGENWLAGVPMKDMPQSPPEPRGFGSTYSKIYSAIVRGQGRES